MSLPSSNSKLTFHNTQNNIYKPTTFPLSFYMVWLMPSILTLLFFTLSLCWPSFCLKTMTHSLLTHPRLSSLVFILCGIAINSKKYIFGLHPQGSSEHRPQKILKEDSVKCVLVMLIRWVFGKDLVTEQQQWCGGCQWSRTGWSQCVRTKSCCWGLNQGWKHSSAGLSS